MATARLARLDKLAQVRQITQQAYAAYIPILGGPPVPVTEDYAPRIAAGEVWLVEQDGGVRGVLVLERHADHLMIFSLAVPPAEQGRGLGRWMLAFADSEASRSGLDCVRLYTNARMERNIALYRRAGYQETGRRPNPHRAGWELVDMAKQIDRPGG